MKYALAGIGLVLAVLASGCGNAGKPKSHVATEALGPPVIHESFKSLPCPGRPLSFKEIEGCERQAVLESDRQVDARVRVIFQFNLTKAARAAFVSGEKAWLNYREAHCSIDSASTGNLRCKAMQNARHLIDLVDWPCSRSEGRIQDEFCLSRAVAKSDREIKARERIIARLIVSGSDRALFLRAKPEPTRVAFLRSERFWFGYRRKICIIEAATFSGGSEQPNVFLTCQVERNAEHLALLRELANYYSMH